MSSSAFDRQQGRDLFGQNAAAYATGRPDYPPEVYRMLRERCGLAPGVHALEVGPGTGTVTAHLLDAGAHVLAVEPNAALAELLQARLATPELDVRVTTFEELDVEDAGIDLLVAGYSWHWVDQDAGARKARRVLSEGGWFTYWYTLFDDPRVDTPFDRAMLALLGPSRGHAMPGTSGSPDGVPMQVDVETQRDYLTAHGFDSIVADVFTSHVTLDGAGLRALYASLSTVLRRPAAEQERLLDEIERLVDKDFAGAVERDFLTGYFAARNPAHFPA